MGIVEDRVAQHKGAQGLSSAKKGFCFSPAYDQIFALGWPHIRFISNAKVEPYKLALHHLMQTNFDLRLQWPRSLAIALVRAWGIGRLYDMAPGHREIREEVQEALWNLEPISKAEATGFIQTRMDTTPMWVGDRATESFVLLLEALTDPLTIAKAVLDVLSTYDRAELFDTRAMPSLITYQLGYLMLRMAPKDAAAIRTRMEDLAYGTAGIKLEDSGSLPRTPCHARSMFLVLQGARAAQATTDHNLRWYTHAVDPVPIQMRAHINRAFTMPDSRLLWIGGPSLLDTKLGQSHTQLDGIDQQWFVEQISPVKSPHVVALFLGLAADSAVRQLARDWLAEHSSYVVPEAKKLAKAGNGDAGAYLGSL